jgi:hypothetical protein
MQSVSFTIRGVEPLRQIIAACRERIAEIEEREVECSCAAAFR